jgi:hypothetical protein
MPIELWIIPVLRRESTDPAYSIGLLGACDKRPSGHSTHNADEFPPYHRKHPKPNAGGS